MAIKRQYVLLLLLIILRNSYGVLRGECRECQANNVACVDERAFATCLNGQMTENLTPCPAGMVCTAEPQICKMQADGFSPSCYDDNCGSCERTNFVFACLDEITYGFCHGETEPDPEAIEKCPSGYVCNVDSEEVCVAQIEGGTPSCVPTPEEPTTTEPPPTPTTPAPPLDPDTFCENLKGSGNFKATDDETCREYIYCYLLSGQYLGIRYKCRAYFNAVSRECQTERPPEC